MLRQNVFLPVRKNRGRIKTFILTREFILDEESAPKFEQKAGEYSTRARKEEKTIGEAKYFHDFGISNWYL